MPSYNYSRPTLQHTHSSSPFAQHSYTRFDDDDQEANYPYIQPTPAPSYGHITPAPSYGARTPSSSQGFRPGFFDEADSIPLHDRNPSSSQGFRPGFFDKEDSVRLGDRNPKQRSASSTSVAHMLPHEEEDPFVRDVDPRKQRRARERQNAASDGFKSGGHTWVVYVLTAVQLIVFLAEIIQNAVLTKSPIEIHPSFNPMIGPSPYVMINMGSRFQPCMHNITGLQDGVVGTIDWPCPNTTSTSTVNGVSGAAVCSLHELCGFGAKTDSPAPDQWWRFIIPIFIHAGIVHIGFNLLLQLTLGRDVERLIGSVRFFILYFASGIFGFVLGGNFAADGISSCGCSGSLFGVLAITLLDLLYSWRARRSPWRDLAFIGVDVCIAFVLGLLPGLDNFSHIGGFLMGIVLGTCILRTPQPIAQRAGTSRPISARAPTASLRNRPWAWWAWWLVRVGALTGVLIAFILLLENFYIWRKECSWCKYLSCLPITVSGTNWCDEGTLAFKANNATSSRRDLLF